LTDTITSLHNERVKLVRALQTSGKSRRKENQIVLEGVRLIADALANGTAPDFVFYSGDSIEKDQPGAALIADLERQEVTCLEITPEVLLHIADTQTPQGLIAVVPMPQLPVPGTLTLALILDGIADPGNLGTILRTAAGSGTDVVMLAPGCVDAFNPKVLRSGMGAHFHIPILRKRWADIERDLAGLPMYLADTHAETRYYSVDWTIPSAIIVGGEAHGAASTAQQIAAKTIAIPMAAATESLNAAVAAGVILFEVRRQRAV